MAGRLGVEQLLEMVRSGEPLNEDAFSVLASLASHLTVDRGETDDRLRELTIRLLDRKAELGPNQDLLMAAARQVGLFPYLETGSLGTADLIAYESNRPQGEGVDRFVFHERQGAVYRRLMAGENVILSAPTSFGKSLIIDAVVAQREYDNIVVLVPTLALIDETRRRLAKFADAYKIISHAGQQPGMRNLFVLTQERFLEFESLPAIDFFVIDEFYKLHPAFDSERSYLLNQALYRLLKQGAQFYFLGPSIESIPTDIQLDARFMNETFQTVALNIRSVRKSPNDAGRSSVVQLCASLEGPTLIFCSSPARAKRVAGWLAEAGIQPSEDPPADAVEWINREYGRGWSVAEAMSRGIGIHHARIPRALAQFMVRAFNDGRLGVLVCTSTLIEGVNTTAKNVVIFDDRIDRKRYDQFTFNNIRGRSGRMNEHFVGNVFVFNPEPEPTLPHVDFPVMTQPEDTPDSLLVQLDDEDLSQDSRDRVASLLDQDVLPLEVLRSNPGFDPQELIDLAKHIQENANTLHSRLSWTGLPTADQHLLACNMMWDRLGGSRRSAHPFVVSARQLRFQVDRLRRIGFRAALESELRERDDPDATIDAMLLFLRQWASFNYPRLLGALDSVQRSVFTRMGLPPGDFRYFASQVEAWFLPAPLVTLEEFGLPVQLGTALSSWLLDDDDSTEIDLVLTRLAALDPEGLDLDPFERELLRWAQIGLGATDLDQ